MKLGAWLENWDLYPFYVMDFDDAEWMQRTLEMAFIYGLDFCLVRSTYMGPRTFMYGTKACNVEGNPPPLTFTIPPLTFEFAALEPRGK